MNMMETKFRVWNGYRIISDEIHRIEFYGNGTWAIIGMEEFNGVNNLKRPYKIATSYNKRNKAVLMQYTGLKDKNGTGLTEVYEGDIIDENGIIKGSIYEMDKRETDIVIPQLGTKAWDSAYKEAVDRGFDYSE